jgi:hypothetical protein
MCGCGAMTMYLLYTSMNLKTYSSIMVLHYFHVNKEQSNLIRTGTYDFFCYKKAAKRSCFLFGYDRCKKTFPILSFL